jgi:nicotinic acid mononucleotide adenylyltransferase
METFLEWLENNKKAILLATGAFSPIHKGHIEMFKISKSHLESLGYEIIKGFVSPKHNDYVSRKTDDYLDIDDRINLIKLAIKESGLNWIEVYDWEARQTKPLGKKYVVNKIKENYPEAEVFFVCGEDNCPLPSYPGIAKIDGFNWISTGRGGFSSTRVRKALVNKNQEELDLMLYPSVKKYLMKS